MKTELFKTDEKSDKPYVEVLFTRQRHEAERAGLHYDYRIVIGDKAFSWATRKETPEPGKSIILHEQPIHTSDYALSKKVVIPKGEYGAGVTTLDWVKKGKVELGDDHYIVSTKAGEKFLLKHIPSYGPKQWLFKNLSGETNKPGKGNKYLEKAAVMIHMWQHYDTGRKTWLQEGKEPG